MESRAKEKGLSEKQTAPKGELKKMLDF